MKKVKNNTESTKTWCGTQILPSEYYTLEELEFTRWATNSIFITAVANSEAVMNDGTSDITDVHEAMNLLTDSVPMQAVVTEQPPFAQPTYRNKRNATSSIVTVAANSYGNVDFKLTAERYVSGGCILVKNAEFGDYATAEVVDVDGVIPELYRAALCESWPTVAMYIEKEWLEATPGGITCHKINTYPLNAKITAGLYLRVTYYTANSGSSRDIAVNYYLTKKL